MRYFNNLIFVGHTFSFCVKVPGRGQYLLLVRSFNLKKLNKKCFNLFSLDTLNTASDIVQITIHSTIGKFRKSISVNEPLM